METTTHTLATARAEYLMACQIEGKSKGTLDIYSRVTNRFCNSTGDKPLSEVTPNDIRSYLVNMDNCSKVTVSIHCRTLRSFFNFLVESNYIEKNPMTEIKTPKVPTIYPHILSEEEVGELLKVARPNPRDYSIMLLILDTGVRATELCGIKLQDLSLATMNVRVLGKGQKERTVYYSKSTAKAISRWLSVRKTEAYEDALFVNCRGEPLTRSGLLQLVRRLGRKAAIKGERVSPHTLRHTAATYYVKEGGDPHSLQMMLGHTTTKMAEKYVGHVRQENMKTLTRSRVIAAQDHHMIA